jgi:hypothetical protein
MNIDDIAYHPFDTIDRAKLARLLASEYAPGHDTLNPAFLDWLYRDNPAGMAGFIVARDAVGEYRGIVGVVPYRLTWGQRPMTAYLALHVLVDKAARGASLFGRMIVVLNNHLAARETFLFGHPNPAAMPSWERNGMRFIDGYALGWNGRLFDTRLNSYRQITKSEGLGGFDFSALAEWRAGLGKPVLSVDRAFLEWRYLSHPTRRYLVALRTQGSEVRGYVAIARSAKAGMDVIVDWQGTEEFENGPPGRFLRPAFVSDASHPPRVTHPKLIKRIPFFATPYAVEPGALKARWDAVSLAACDFL